MSKKWISLALAALMLPALFAGCANSAGEAEPTATTGMPIGTESPVIDNSGAAAFDRSAGLEDNGFFEDVKASGYLTLPEYKGVPMSADVLTAADADVQSQIDTIMSSFTEYEQITDRAVQDGDTLNIDFVGKVDGVPFENGSTEGAGTDVTIGVTNYIPGFLDQLVGHKPGETFDIDVTFPENYSEPTLQGKAAVFTITINYIRGDAKNTELTDEIASEYGFDTAAALVADIRTWLVSEQKKAFAKELLAASQYEKVPQSMLDYIISSDLSYYEQYAASYEITVDELFAQYTQYESEAAYVEANNANYVKTAVYYLACQAIAEKEGLTVADELIASSGFESYKDQYGLPYIRMYLLQEVVVPNFIVNNAAVQKSAA